MNIAFTYNVRHFDPLKNRQKAEEEAEFDSPKTIRDIKNSLESLGHKVFLVEANKKAYLKFKKLKPKIDLVFNYAEGIYGKDREAQIPAMLEMLEIPYTGDSPLSYAIGLNKVKTKEILAYHGILTPKWQVFKTGKEKISKKLKFPLLVKPQAEGSSKGIFSRNLVKNERELRKIVREEIKKYKQPALVEKFLQGREFTVAVLGTPPRVLPIIEVKFDELPKGMPKFDHYEAKWIYDNPKFKADPLVCPAKISKKLEKKIKESVLKAFEILEMADWARFDIRLDKKGRPNILEVNCPAGIIPDPKENSRFPRAGRAAGLNFQQLLRAVIDSALKRYKIKLKIQKL
jgi:D-alanine-D-alanine ligase